MSETDHSARLMKALIAKLYNTITGGDENIKIPRNKFVSWFMPGVPFYPEDFKFCQTGFVVSTPKKRPEVNTTESINNTSTESDGNNSPDDEIDSRDVAGEINQLYHQAFVLSKLFDFVPDTDAVVDGVLQRMF